MSYDVKNLSSVALAKILLVLDDIKLISELRNRNHFLLYKLGNLANITKDEQESVLLRLLSDKTVKETSIVSFWSDCYMIRIDEAFFDFYNKAKAQIERENSRRTVLRKNDERFPRRLRSLPRVALNARSLASIGIRFKFSAENLLLTSAGSNPSSLLTEGGIFASFVRRHSQIPCPRQRQMLIRICRRSLRQFSAENSLTHFCRFESLSTSNKIIKTGAL